MRGGRGSSDPPSCACLFLCFLLQLSSNSVDENSDVDTVVGMLSTADPDKGQTYSYTLLDGAGGRFKIQGNTVKVNKVISAF